MKIRTNVISGQMKILHCDRLPCRLQLVLDTSVILRAQSAETTHVINPFNSSHEHFRTNAVLVVQIDILHCAYYVI